MDENKPHHSDALARFERLHGKLSESDLARDNSGAYARYEAMMAREQAENAAEQERRRGERVPDTRDALLRVALRQLQDNKLFDGATKQKPDPWECMLRGVEKRRGTFVAWNSDGRKEYRIRSRYLLSTVLCVEPTAINHSAVSGRLGRVMRSLGWEGPSCMRIDGLSQKGYRKLKDE